MTMVIDSSVVIAWLMPDESNEFADKVIETALSSGAHVPSLWKLEVSNVILVNHKRKRIDDDMREQLISDFHLLDFSVDTDPIQSSIHTIIQLSVDHHLTTYDSTYLELAMRLRAPLASLDKRLNQAAQNLAVPIFSV